MLAGLALTAWPEFATQGPRLTAAPEVRQQPQRATFACRDTYTCMLTALGACLQSIVGREAAIHASEYDSAPGAHVVHEVA